jgi:hypothetical protein
MRYFSNVAALATLTNVGGISTGATEITPSTTTGFPSQYPYTLSLEPDTANEELVTVTGPKSGSPGTLVITRASDGTTAKSHAAGSVIVHRVSARDLQEPQDHIANVTPAGVHGLPESAWESTFTLYKSVDQGYSSKVTLTDDTVLKFAAVANTKYRVELFAICSGSGGDIALAWNVPSGAGGLRSVLGPTAASTNRDDTNMRSGAHGFGAEIAYGLNSDDALWTSIQERFVISIGATPGNVILQHRQNTTSAVQTIMRASSYMTVTKLING